MPSRVARTNSQKSVVQIPGSHENVKNEKGSLVASYFFRKNTEWRGRLLLFFLPPAPPQVAENGTTLFVCVYVSVMYNYTCIQICVFVHMTMM